MATSIGNSSKLRAQQQLYHDSYEILLFDICTGGSFKQCWENASTCLCCRLKVWRKPVKLHPTAGDLNFTPVLRCKCGRWEGRTTTWKEFGSSCVSSSGFKVYLSLKTTLSWTKKERIEMKRSKPNVGSVVDSDFFKMEQRWC